MREAFILLTYYSMEYINYIFNAFDKHQSICITDSKGTFIYLSKYATERTGYTIDKLKTLNAYSVVSKGIIDVNPIIKTIETQKEQHQICHYYKTGKDFLVHTIPIFNNANKLVFTVSYCKPIRKNSSIVLNDHNEEYSNHSKINKTRIICDTLDELKIPKHIKGYIYLMDAIIEIIEAKDFMYSITKEIYPRLSNKHKASCTSIEKNIRFAIKLSFQKCETNITQKYFGINASKPTNREFISSVATSIINNY